MDKNNEKNSPLALQKILKEVLQAEKNDIGQKPEST